MKKIFAMLLALAIMVSCLSAAFAEVTNPPRRYREGMKNGYINGLPNGLKDGEKRESASPEGRGASYSLTIANVGEVTTSATPSSWQTALMKVVLPAPILP